ncbi:MAG TPA: hypothetical protein VFB74_34055 [Kribbellaceae bacterium]|nr:hypothetical protein [Kribbellaceae bacterium]
MAEPMVLELRVVDQAAAVGRKLGELRRTESGRVSSQGDVAESILLRVMRAVAVDRTEAFDLLAVNGWSNGHLVLVAG